MDINIFPPQIFFCGSRVLKLFCHKVEAANAILSVAKNNWNGDFPETCREKKTGLADLVKFLKLLALYLAIIYSWQLSNSSH